LQVVDSIESIYVVNRDGPRNWQADVGSAYCWIAFFSERARESNTTITNLIGWLTGQSWVVLSFSSCGQTVLL
jgi:hypothetical protein